MRADFFTMAFSRNCRKIIGFGTKQTCVQTLALPLLYREMGCFIYKKWYANTYLTRLKYIEKIECLIYATDPQIGGYYSSHTSFWKMDFCPTFSFNWLLKFQLMFAKESSNLPACEEGETTSERSIIQVAEHHQEYMDSAREWQSWGLCSRLPHLLHFHHESSKLMSPGKHIQSTFAVHGETNLAFSAVSNKHLS